VIGWLNANAALVSLFFSGVVAAATVVYAVLTSRLVTETWALRRAETDPQVPGRHRSGGGRGDGESARGESLHAGQELEQAAPGA